jgi:NAD(P)-dependent dehydrogenase (short-subunit alcohol dehydrogenase family)
VTAARSVLVTGASDGIGRATAASLAALGLQVLVHGRNEQRAVAAARGLRGTPLAVIPVWGDFASLGEVLALASQVTRAVPVLDILINNAGMYASARKITRDGFECTMAVNYFAPWLLTQALLPALEAAPQARVINVSSMTHAGAKLDLDDLDITRDWSAYGAYSTSKLCNLLFNLALATRYCRLCVTALHPGVISTKLLRQGFSMGGDTVDTGAETSVYLATAAHNASISGRYFVDCRRQDPSRQARDKRLADNLWVATEDRLRDYLAAV